MIGFLVPACLFLGCILFAPATVLTAPGRRRCSPWAARLLRITPVRRRRPMSRAIPGTTDRPSWSGTDPTPRPAVTKHRKTNEKKDKAAL